MWGRSWLWIGDPLSLLRRGVGAPRVGPLLLQEINLHKVRFQQLTNSPYKKVQDNNERSIRSEKKRYTMGPLCKMFIYSVVLGGKCIDMSTATCHMSMSNFAHVVRIEPAQHTKLYFQNMHFWRFRTNLTPLKELWRMRPQMHFTLLFSINEIW